MNQVNLQKVHDFLCELARECGAIISSHSGKETFDDKKNSVDLVTVIDRCVETLVSERIRAQFPECQFIGEETYVEGETKLGNEPTFIVDPIDGTTNFIHNFPYSCISLGFSIEKRPVVGVIYNPHLDMLFHAIQGQGAYKNGVKLNNPTTSKPKLTLQSSLVALESGSDRDGVLFERKTDMIRNLIDKDRGFIHGFRSLGSAAMNICHVATGQLDSYWEGGCQMWDVCAGWVILEETGGVCVGGNPGCWENSIDSRVYLFTRGADPEDQKKYVEEFWSNTTGPLEY
jgi:myo-inositol-1(or 4)-monophosphatase